MLGLRNVLLALVALSLARVESRPQFFDVTKVATGGIGLLETAGRTGGAVSNVASDAIATAQTFGEGARDIFRDTLQIGADGLNRFGSVVRDTTGEAVRGFQDATRATTGFFANGFRATGQLATDTVSTGFEVARDAVGAKADFLKNISRVAVQGAGKVAGAVGNFVEGAIDNTVGLVAPSSQIVERVINKGIQGLSGVIVPAAG